MTDACVRLLPVYVDLLGFLADGQSVHLGVVVLDCYLEEEMAHAGFGQVLQCAFLDLPLIFGYEGFFLQFECSLFELVDIQPEFILSLL